MLPDIRAIIAAVVTAIGLLTISFGLVATFRVAQDLRAGVLQADLAQRGRMPLPVNSEPHLVRIVETPPPPPPPKPQFAETLAAVPVAPVIAAAPLPEPTALAPEPPAPPAEPPVGGPLPEQVAAVHTEAPPRNIVAEKAAKKATAQKATAQKARAARIARERKTAARRAAQVRRARQKAAVSSNTTFGDPFGNTFGNNAFGQGPSGRRPRAGAQNPAQSDR